MYITYYAHSKPTTQILNYADIMRAENVEQPITHYKTTIYIQRPTPLHSLQNYQKHAIEQAQNYLDEAYMCLQPFKDNYETQYYEFQIPKRSGGLRTINAPNFEFKKALTKVKDIFEQKLKCLAHDCAYAYVKQRSVKDALEKHQKNQSNWYLKIDLKDFFPNCTPNLIYNNLKQLYPFYYFDEAHNETLKKVIDICCLHNGLPQGTPMSPLLTNLVMIPYDFKLNNILKRGRGNHWVYTRYADDILISAKSNFNWQELEQTLAQHLYPFEIKHSKTRYGSKAGSNWNLGLMLNKDNNITLGSSKKRLINAMLNNYLRDRSNQVEWDLPDKQHLQGQLSYLKNIEPEYYAAIVNKYTIKYNTALTFN